jgi:hypothetical protein
VRKRNVMLASLACVCITFGGYSAFPGRSVGSSVAVTPFARGMYESRDNTHSPAFRALGFNAVNVEPDPQALRTLETQGLRGVVWLGGYDAKTCTFELSDADIAARVARVAGSSAILSYYLVDEPEQNLLDCPRIPDQIAARSRLVKSLDPAHATYIVLGDSAYVRDGNGGSRVEMYPYRPFVGTADIIGLAVYPCLLPATSPCDFGEIAAAIKMADQVKIPNYWAVIQDFAATKWRRPTVAELHRQLTLWAASRWQGYFVFSWDWQGNSLASLADHQAALQEENRRFAAPG